MNDKKEPEPSFEQGLGRLEELVEELESGEPDLDRSLLLFEQGIRLVRTLGRKLDEAERRIDQLIKDESGRLKAEPFSLEPEDDDR
jgi:exodeoxyribonuclease VII small subunit